MSESLANSEPKGSRYKNFIIYRTILDTWWTRLTFKCFCFKMELRKNLENLEKARLRPDLSGLRRGKGDKMNPEPKKKSFLNQPAWLKVILIAIGLFLMFQLCVGLKNKNPEIPYTDFMKLVEQNKVGGVASEGRRLTAILKEPIAIVVANSSWWSADDKKQEQEGVSKVLVIVPEGRQGFTMAKLQERGVKIAAKEPKSGGGDLWVWILLGLLPLVLFWFFFRGMFGQMTSQMNQNKDFGQSKARVHQDTTKAIFDDVAGCDEAKEELKEVIEFLNNPQKFSKLGAKIPKGVLLMGPPGTGKTLLARAVAGEADVPFLTLSGSDFVEMFVGVGAARVRNLFETAKKAAPCIIFIDEIDAVGRQRGTGLGGGHDEREQTLNQLFVEMDGFEANLGIIVIAATNRPDVLDPALLRPGRFDRHITVGLPDINGREAILEVHTKNTILAKDIDLREIARGTPMFSGADLANLINEAALLASRQDKDAIYRGDLERAKDRIIMGLEKKGLKMTEREREIIAYHEAGHTLVAKILPGADPIHKVSIIPRGRALGVTSQLPEEDRYIAPKSYMLNELAILLGGRAAELIKFGESSSGASNDIQAATVEAQKMVCKYGMSDKLGAVAWGKEAEDIFLGRQIVQSRGYSEQTAREIDEEVKMLVDESLKTAKKIIEENQAKFEALTKALLEKETLDSDEVSKVLAEN